MYRKTIILLIAALEIGAGIFLLFGNQRIIATALPLDTLFAVIPPPEAKAIEASLASQDTPALYQSGETFLSVEGDMILAHVNKTFALPSWYVPPELVSLAGKVKTVGAERLRTVVLPDLEALITDVEAACGCEMAVLSAYRSYQTQAAAYNYWVGKMGYYAANRGSARPGHSEHQLGTTVDLTSSTAGYQLTRDLGNTCEGVWLERNAYLYGFVLSYPQSGEAITGYAWEPWHFRWVGKTAAAEVKTAGITLEEFLAP